MAKVLITGGAGFIGSNLANRLLGEGQDVTIFDSLARPGGSRNVDWLRDVHGPANLHLVRANLTDFNALRRATEGAEHIYHLAGQVAVTTSVTDPRGDFEDNALGTLNVLEAARTVSANPILLYSSTNKVYGKLDTLDVVEESTRYRHPSIPHGISELQPLDFHSPYGCSKGAGDQYVHDYHRIYGLRTVVLRQSCIYGPRQFGVEDQGWVAWFVIAAMLGRPITIYGDGKQVRDLLYVDDLLDAYQAAVDGIERSAGQIYNVGGGSGKTLSIWAEFRPLLEELLERPIEASYGPWRPGDQPVYVSDIRKVERDLAWRPQTTVHEGIERLVAWVRDNRELFGG